MITKNVTIKSRVNVVLRGDIQSEFITFNNLIDGKEHFAIRFGEIKQNHSTLVRVHSECLTGDVFGSGRCDCGDQLKEAVNLLSHEGGYLLYMRQEGRGIGLYSKLDAYLLQDSGLDTFEANRALHLPEDGRDYEPAAQMLKALGLSATRLLTNNPVKVKDLIHFGIDITEQVPTSVFISPYNKKYLQAKVTKQNHMLDIVSETIATQGL
jgi:GTP cyclohydrolase II